MRKIHDPREYHRYKAFTSNNSNKTSSSDYKPTGLGWVVICIVVYALIFFIFDGADGESISTLLGLGVLAYLYAQWISK